MDERQRAIDAAIARLRVENARDWRVDRETVARLLDALRGNTIGRLS
jgi:hypothetical protein